MARYTILVVEDDDVQRRQIARVLLKAGYNVSEAPDGLEAIRLVDALGIDLVLTDLRMPCLSGISLLKYIKTFHPKVPVMVVTAYPEDTEQLKPDVLLRKPFGEDELMACVRRLINAPDSSFPYPGEG
jgi:CheY-like chemotaxis protein